MSEPKFPLTSALYVDALSSSDTLGLLIPRIRAALPSLRDRRKQKQIEDLIISLQDLETVIGFGESQVISGESNGENAFFEGIPRCSFQIENQFGHYLNPESSWQNNWTRQRLGLWDVFEKTIPWMVREVLMSWRWRAENDAFRKILEELKKSRLLVARVEEKLIIEEKRSTKKSGRISVIDRLRIVFWAKSAKKDEDTLLLLEQNRDELARRISTLLEECEKLAAVTAAGMRTLFVDCGEFYSRVFEGCCRAIDREIKIQIENDLKMSVSKNTDMSLDCEEILRVNQDGIRRINDQQQKLIQAVDGRFDSHFFEAERILSQEFMCLNALELEKQDQARSRWQRAITQMRRILGAAEESFNYGENDTRDVVDDSNR